MPETRTTEGEHHAVQPDGMVLTPEEVLIVWKNLVHCNESEVRDLRRKLKRFLECLTH